MMTNVELTISAEPSECSKFVFEPEFDDRSIELMKEGIEMVCKENNVGPHTFTITKCIEHWPNTAPFGFKQCAMGAVKLALNLSDEEVNFPFSKSSANV